MYFKFTLLFFAFIINLHSYSMERVRPIAKEKYLFLDEHGRTHSSDELESREPIPGYSIPMDEEFKKHVLDVAPKKVNDTIWLMKNWPDRFEKTRFLMLLGNPGSGKKTIARAIGAELNLPCYMYPGRNLINQYQNSGNQNILKIFKHAAKNQPCAVIIDNLDNAIQWNEHPEYPDSTFNALKACIEGFSRDQILFIGTHGYCDKYPEDLKDFFIYNTIEIPKPDIERRKKIIEYNQKKSGSKTLFAPAISTQELAQKTKRFSPRELKYLTRAAVDSALLKLNDESEEPVVTQEIYDKEIAKARKRLGYEQWHEKAAPYLWKAAPYALIGATAVGALVLYNKSQQPAK